jgi:hypothetical protein
MVQREARRIQYIGRLYHLRVKGFSPPFPSADTRMEPDYDESGFVSTNQSLFCLSTPVRVGVF